VEGLVKIALNAQKAREMAGEAGLFPAGNWKWALRNLRGERGDLLEGRELAEAKEGLGKLPNNIRQKFNSLARGAGYNKEVGGVARENTPIGQLFNGKVNRNDIVPGTRMGDISTGDQISVDNVGHLINQEGNDYDEIFDKFKGITHDVHTHPYKSSWKHQNAAAATDKAIEPLQEFAEFYPKGYIEQAKKRTLAENHASLGVGQTDHRLVQPSGLFSRKSEPGAYSKDNVEELLGQETGDYKGMALQRIYNPNAKSTILDPLFGNESVHKARPQGLRSVYFKNQGQYN
jgi:hypothetical protein